MKSHLFLLYHQRHHLSGMSVDLGNFLPKVFVEYCRQEFAPEAVCGRISCSFDRFPVPVCNSNVALTRRAVERRFNPRK